MRLMPGIGQTRPIILGNAELTHAEFRRRMRRRRLRLHQRKNPFSYGKYLWIEC